MHFSKRLDGILCNDKMKDIFHSEQVEHLVRIGSDHTTMLIKFRSDNAEFVRTFNFPNF